MHPAIDQDDRTAGLQSIVNGAVGINSAGNSYRLRGLTVTSIENFAARHDSEVGGYLFVPDDPEELLKNLVAILSRLRPE